MTAEPPQLPESPEPPEPSESPEPSASRLSRRALLGGGGVGVVAGLAAGFWGGRATAGTLAPDDAGSIAGPDSQSPDPQSPAAVPVHGAQQAGIVRPATVQRNTVVLVADLGGDPGADEVLAALAAFGAAVERCADAASADPRVLPDGPGDVTVTIGIGPRLVRAIDPALPASADLPAFAGDERIDPSCNGGDVLISVCGSDAAPLHAVAAEVLASVPSARLRWMQAGVRGAGEGTIARNPLGFHDGVIVPHTPDELADNVWIAAGPAAGGTVAVIRRLRLDTARFRALEVPDQEHVIGRTLVDGAPLSGGGPTDEADLGAKSPEGEYLVPLHSHVRAAHPSFTGSKLMLRRGFAYSNAPASDGRSDDGLMFICFQHDADVFVRTQVRLDETDALMAYATATASAVFLIPPGWTRGGTLGATLHPR